MAKGQVSSGWKKTESKGKKSRDSSDEKAYKPLKATGEWGTFEPKSNTKGKKSTGKQGPKTSSRSRAKLGDTVNKPFNKRTSHDGPKPKKTGATHSKTTNIQTKGVQKKEGTDLKRINRNLNFKREETKTNARKDWTRARCIVCKQEVILPFKPRNPDIYCDKCVKKYKYKTGSKETKKPQQEKPKEKPRNGAVKFVRKKAEPSEGTYKELF